MSVYFLRQVTPSHESYEELERLYWSYDLIDRSDDPIYGADVPATLIHPDAKIWNVGEDVIFNDFGERLTRYEGGSYLYFGMWRSTFSWHIEDMDLYGINYLHYGAPKTWYCVPPQHGHKLELAARELFSDWAQICFNFLRHKVCMISPELLARRGIKVQKVVQEERDLIIVFPHAYHAGFNHGFNIAEASNFGSPAWVEHGKRHRPCACSHAKSAIKIDMEPLVELFQPERLERWRAGRDLQPHPDDSQEMKNIFSFCLEVLQKEDSEIDVEQFDDDAKIFYPKKLKMIENDEIVYQYIELTMKEKTARLRTCCQKQIEHFTLFRDILPEMQDLLKIQGETLTEMKLEEDEVEKGMREDIEQRKMVRIDMDLLRKAKRSRVRILKSKLVQEHVSRLPVRTEDPPANLSRSSSLTEVVKRHGFASLSVEELEAKRSLKKCPIKHKLRSCGKCSGCLLADCGACPYCRDKPKFGGENVLKQKCIQKKCSNPVVRFCDKCTWNL